MSLAVKQPFVSPVLPAQTSGQVREIKPDGSVLVHSEGRGWICQRAASCLLTPQIDDSVLLANCGQQIWLLAILTRANTLQPAVISVEGSLHISPSDTLSLTSRQFVLNADEGECQVGNMNYRGKTLSAWVNVSRVMGKCCETVWQSMTQISHRLLRKTTQLEQVRAGQLDVKVEQFTRMHAHTTLISSKTLTKIDAKQIHMG
ncbi:DUF3540 domain-containing protein [Rouxiella silvae]|uniref:DUF3540 domain-containing protein n=1 Tax=Rouxiella silvae TaxID=1646373 RepID=A0AA41BWD1_9GAMM|nr:DUF3540 domain-containing protein [Rouxiella silvae]KQN52026.1 hypothetical protein ASE93_02415 [Serratia sp. Leaf50]MBF6637110.1 DUF3540 domain-containing protein [Rouxiella silvae]